MHLNRIKISGFKSFAEEVELILEPGVTTIVGPNGCGKSNVSDAIRWVLGEQSARALRCTNMRELLFNGGANFSPARKAEVGLFFSDISENLSIGSPEVEVHRQLTRDGESSYLINQTPCRLRDISELFMDTGVGVDAYSVMEQSKIDLILNVRPEERRFLFDEVAGITKYKHRKKTALRKLEETEQNLVRINDIIQELQRETESLKTQAEQAERYQSLQAQLRQLELNLAYREYMQLATAYREMQDSLAAAINDAAEANQQLQGAEEQLDSAAHHRSELDTAISAVEEKLSGISEEIEKIERQIVLHKERQLSIQQQRQRALQTLESLKARQENLLIQKRERTQEQRKLESAFKIEESRLTARQQLLTELSERLRATNESIQEAETVLQETTTELTQQENKRLAIEHKVTSTASNLNRIKESSDSLKAELKTATDAHAEVQRAEVQLKATLLQIEAEKKQADTSLHENQDALRKVESEMRGLQDTLGGSVSRLKSLQELQSAYEGYYTGVRAIMQAKTHFPDEFNGICGVVAELLSTDTEYEVAIEVALGSAIQNVVTETAEDADAGIAFLKKHRAGRVTFLPLDILRGRTFSDHRLLDEPGVIGIAQELLDYDSRYEIAIQHLLGNTLVIEDLDAAVALTRRFRPNARLVTLDGEVINTSGAITGGHTNQKTTGLLSRARELEVLESRIEQMTQQANEKDEKRKTYVTTIATLQQTRQKLTTQLQGKQIEQAALAKDIEQTNQQVTRLETQLAEVEVEDRDLRETMEVSREEQQALDAEIAELTKKRTLTERRIQRMNEQIQSETRKREEVASACQQMEVFLAGQRQKLQGLTDEIETFAETQRQTEQGIEEQQAIIDADEQTKDDLSEQLETAQREFLRIEGNRAEAETEREELTEKRDALIAEIADRQKEMRATRRQFDKHNRVRHQLEVKTTQLEMQIKHISTGIFDKYQLSIEEIPQPFLGEVVPPAAHLETGLPHTDHNPGIAPTEEKSENRGVEAVAPLTAIAEQDVDTGTAPTLFESPATSMNDIDLMDSIEKLKAEIAAMGAVNLKAIEAHEEHKKRYDFLASQRADIQKSIQSTYQAIQKINQTSREVFLKTFEQVQTNFQEVFVQLFGGGETELRLTDDSDVLDSGIDIIARPPGKRPQSITQLSGGERSLVAIGLLFAVFKIKPSPFCVLDEVDASLDEANVLRFTNLIRAYAENTQFVIITHNRRTMEIADAMYGVTMEQAGMSKIVSAKFAA